MRKIQKNEMRMAAQKMAECFSDYPLYDVFFPDSPNRLKQVYYFFWFRIYTRRNFTYITEDGELLASYQKPGEQLCSPLGLLLNPVFLFGFLRYIPLRALKQVREYSEMEAREQQKYYHPEEDWYLQVACVLKSSRGNGTFFRIAKETDEGDPLYCETHTERNARLYRLMGFHICSQTEWHGVTHYVLRRERKN